MKKWIKIVFWTLFTVGVFVIMSLTKAEQEEYLMEKPAILIEASDENAFLTKDELYTRLVRAGLVFPGQKFKDLNLRLIEQNISKMSEVLATKAYTNIGGSWNIDVKIRKPIARIYNKYGENYYLDELGFIMIPSYLYTARVVIVTGNIPDRITSPSANEIMNNDTLKTIQNLDEIYRISKYVCNDPFLNSQIGQIHLLKNGDFVLIPQVGGQTIVFGSAKTDEEVEDKFQKLIIFYQQGLPFEGWEKYKEINLKYKKQIVCKKK